MGRPSPQNVKLFPFSALTLLVERQEGHLACKKVGVSFLLVTVSLSFSCLIAPAVTITAIIFSSNKIQNGDILVSANLVCP